MQLLVIINSVVCVAGAVAGLLFAGASIISIANMQVPWRGGLIVAALLIPVVFAASGGGAWLALWQGMALLVIGLVALPWLYAAAFVLLMLFSFKQ
jgi:hypothetical protein